jgi:hypothetical protein
VGVELSEVRVVDLLVGGHLRILTADGKRTAFHFDHSFVFWLEVHDVFDCVRVLLKVKLIVGTIVL